MGLGGDYNLALFNVWWQLQMPPLGSTFPLRGLLRAGTWPVVLEQRECGGAI